MTVADVCIILAWIIGLGVGYYAGRSDGRRFAAGTLSSTKEK